jgi:hypothetical protein
MSANSTLSPAAQGALLSAAAYAEPPIKPTGLALAAIIIAITTTAFTTLVVSLRVFVRLWMARVKVVWGWDDTFAVLGCVSLSTIASSILEAICTNLFARSFLSLAPYLPC